MEQTSNWKGHIAECKAAARAMELGYIPNRPSMDCRYDLVLDDGQKLWRVQVKYANGNPSHSKGVVRANLTYETRHRRNTYRYTESEIDALVVYIPQIDKLCWFPPELYVNKAALFIRIEPSRNNQKTKIIYASDYFW